MHTLELRSGNKQNFPLRGALKEENIEFWFVLYGKYQKNNTAGDLDVWTKTKWMAVLLEYQSAKNPWVIVLF